MVKSIVSGRWKPGQILPSEIALASEFGVSQGTVRKALKEMEAQHLVVRQQGRGTFVSEHNAQRSLFHFFHIVDDRGNRKLPVSRVIWQRTQPATDDQAEQLKLGPRAPVHMIQRVRYLSSRPVIVEWLCLPAESFPGLELPMESEMSDELYVLYQQRFRIFVGNAREALRAVAAGAEEAKYLDVPVGTPLLQIERVAFDLSGRPVELRTAHCYTEHHHYSNVIE
ncbi:MAG: GntR family transcriptional regulator [Ectothiorhodospiraceae bacterium]|nr:GntR family transcriptional regulator [Ectothiorhodospiraceae bacterium]